MLIEDRTHPRWLSKSYLVAAGNRGVMIDAGAEVKPLLESAVRHGVRITHVVVTHRHPDHTQNLAAIVAATGAVVVAHADEAEVIGGVDQTVIHDEELITGDLKLRFLHLPGHTTGHLAVVTNNEAVFTGDVLFRRSIGGCVGAGCGSFAQLQHSLMQILMQLPPELPVYPGHMDPTTIGEEWESNPFIRIMRGVDPPGEERAWFKDRPAVLMLRAQDYDGGTKAWIRNPQGGGDLIAPGSAVHIGEQPLAW
jgi:glyoxylase-like metal-dependent hydrolase (beta-lactamase superfamily II)